MGRSGHSNPMQAHHKKARQKEAQRNKKKRNKEHDEQVLQTKTIKEVKEEIQKVELDLKRHNHSQQQKSNAERKLVRLQKDLRLLEEAAAAAKAKADADAEAYRIANKYRQPQRPLTELDDPRKSIYYDPVMNPYGAPPPGKPRLYHRRYGGVTPNPNEAVVPGEEAPPPPPPPPPRDDRHAAPPRHGHFRGDHRHNNNNRNSHHQKNAQKPYPNQQSQPQQDRSSNHSQNPPKRQPLHMPPASQSQLNSDDAQNKTDKSRATKEETPVAEPQDKPTKDKAPQNSGESQPKAPVIPSLPAPSMAVQRTMRVARNKHKTKKALADIWASTEEVEYERLTNRVDLEADDLGTAKASKKKNKKKKKKKPPLEFYYRDTAGNVQGPYAKAQMRAWIDAGYFPLTTKARTNRMDPDGWVPMGDLPALKEEPEKNSNDSVQDRIAALKGSNDDDDDDDNEGMDSSMRARIAAMRADLMASSVPTETPVDEDSVQGRIDALKGNANTNDDDDDMDPSMQARIAAMKADLMASSAPVNQVDDIADTVQGRIAALRGNIDANDQKDGEDDDMDPPMQARIAAMRADLGGPAAIDQTDESENSSLQDRIAALRKNAPIPAPQNEDIDYEHNSVAVQERIASLRRNAPLPANHEQITGETSGDMSVQERIAALRKNAPPPPPPPPPAYHVNTSNNYSDEPGPSAYPLDDTGVAAYPIDDEEDASGVVAYPASYPLDEAGVAAYPLGDADDVDDAVAPYPTDEAYPGAEDLEYPVTEAYGAVEESYGSSNAPYPSEGVASPNVGAQKVVKVDKALVSFVPTNIQNKKRRAEDVKDGDNKKKINASTKAATTSDEKYDKFLKEIDEL